MGADVVVGSSQRFGVPLFYGGPHAGFMSVSRRPRAPPARPPRRRLGRRRGPPGLPPRPADPRAAHPPRQGHLQHLHRPGAAGRRGVDVRRLPRSRRAAPDRAAHPRPRRPDRRRPARRRRSRSSTTRGSTRSPSPCPAGPTRSSPPRATVGPAPAADRRRPRRRLHLRAHQPVDGVRRAARLRASPASGRRDGRAGLPSALHRTTEFLTHPVFNAAPQRDADAALPRAARRTATTRSTAA